MATTLNADTVVGGAIITGDASGVLELQAAGSTKATVNGSGLTLASALPVGSGGTGATTLTSNNVLLGNGTSAVQFVAPGTNGNVLTSNGTTWTSTAPSGGSYVLISTTTGSGVSTLDITSGFTSTYQAYVIYFQARHSGAHGMTTQVYTSSTLRTSSYSSTVQGFPSGTSTFGGLSGTSTAIRTYFNSQNNYDIIFEVSNPNNTSFLSPVRFSGTATEPSGSGEFFFGVGGTNSVSTGPLTGLRFISTTNVNMTAYMYGIKP